MAPTTIKAALAETLEDLTNDNFQRFCEQLLDRREKPQIRRCRLEGKSRREVANVLVSTFTEAGSVEVTLRVLRLIGCGEEAERLDSQTKHFLKKVQLRAARRGKEAQKAVRKKKAPSTAPSPRKRERKTRGQQVPSVRGRSSRFPRQSANLDNGDPHFRKTVNGRLDLKPTLEALNRPRPPKASRAGVKTPEKVATEAKKRVLSEGGDPGNDRLVLSRFIIQFGKYKGQTFKWLLENDVGWTAWLVDSHQNEKEKSGQSLLALNKDFLIEYSTAYPKFLEEVQLCAARRVKEASRKADRKRKALSTAPAPRKRERKTRAQ